MTEFHKAFNDLLESVERAATLLKDADYPESSAEWELAVDLDFACRLYRTKQRKTENE